MFQLSYSDLAVLSCPGQSKLIVAIETPEEGDLLAVGGFGKDLVHFCTLHVNSWSDCGKLATAAG